MKLVLFGAGASVGAGLQTDPPLLSNLLKELKVFAPLSWGRLTSKEQGFFENNFEEGMERLLGCQIDTKKGERFQLKFPLEPRQVFLCDLQWDMAEYFFGFVLKSDSHYEELLTHSQQAGGKVEYSTLNYDTLLIQAVNRILANLPNIRFSVSFPHGNSAIFCEACLDVDGRITAPPGHAVEFNPTIYGFMQSNGPIRFIGDLAELRRLRQQGSLFPPVICHINPSKYVTSGANFIDEQQEKLRRQIRQAEKIVIIGMRVNDNDDHIWAPLRLTSGHILYISGASSGQEFEHWRVKHSRKCDRAILTYWDQAKDDVYDFLSI